MKKIVFALSLAIFFCLTLAVMVSAQNVYLEKIPNELKLGETDTVTHFVVFEEEKYFTGSGTTISGLNTGNMEADMTEANIDASKLGTNYLVRFNFPATFGGNTVTCVNVNAFKGNTTYFIGKCGYLQFPSTMTQTTDMNQCTGSLRCIDFGEDSQLASLPYLFCPGANNLMSVKNFPRNLTSIGASAFDSCYNAFKGELYVNATTISGNAFNNSVANVTKLTFGPNVTRIDGQAFTVRMVELTSGVPADGKIQITDIEFQCDVSAVTFNSNAFYFGGGWTRWEYSHLKTILLAHPSNEKLVNEGVSILGDFTSSTVLFDGTDGSTYFVTPKHTFVESDVSYDKGFFSNGATTVCSNCGKAGVYTAAPIFSCGGYSIPIDGTMSISILYMVDYDALKAYEEASGNTLNFGLIIGFKSVIGNNAPLDENGEQASDSLLQIKVPSDYTNVEVKVNNIPEESAETVLLLCGYVKETDSENNVIGITYVEETETDAENLVGVSFQALLEKSGEAEQ